MHIKHKIRWQNGKFYQNIKIEIIAKLNTIVSRKHYKTDKILF